MILRVEKSLEKKSIVFSNNLITILSYFFMNIDHTTFFFMYRQKSILFLYSPQKKNKFEIDLHFCSNTPTNNIFSALFLLYFSY
jgi:hypothetical protein